MRVLLADADTAFATLVASALDGQPNITLVGCAVDREQALKLALAHTPDIAFIALDMPGGIEAAQNMLRVMQTPPRIILLSAENPGAGLAALADVRAHGTERLERTGFSGYMAKTADAGEMIRLLAALAALTTTPPDATNGDSH